MGMTIDNANKLLSIITSTITEDDDYFTIEDENLQVFKETLLTAIDTMRKYQMMQADYEARLKADLVAVCTELQIKFEENTVRWYVGRVDGKSDDVVLMETINDIIQQKINVLKEN